MSSAISKTTRFFAVHGKVQQVMFRQTFIRGCIKRGLDGGASNDEKDKTLVKLTMRGDNTKIEEIVCFCFHTFTFYTTFTGELF